MKRTPLQRKTPMKRSTKPMRRVSVKREEWNRRYLASIESDADEQVCAITGMRAHKGHLTRHHPKGRLNERIMFYFYVTASKHNEFHARGEWAREHGYILPEMSGRQSEPDTPNPWKGKEPRK